MMNNISKLELIGVGGREIVHISDMSYEVEGNTLKVFLTKDDILPLELTPIMDKEDIDDKFVDIAKALSDSIKRFPNCKIANCDCDSKHGQRLSDCHCLCHIEEIKKDIEKKGVLNE